MSIAELTGTYANGLICNEEHIWLNNESMVKLRNLLDHPMSEGVTVMAMSNMESSPLGTVRGVAMKLKNQVMPKWFGPDPGCGTLTVNLGKIDIGASEFIRLDSECDDLFPRDSNPIQEHSARFVWDSNMVDASSTLLQGSFDDFLVNLTSASESIRIPVSEAFSSIGTLFFENHFIEIGKSEKDGSVWLTIHSGSNWIGRKFMGFWVFQADDAAQEDFNRLFREELRKIRAEYPMAEIDDQLRLRGLMTPPKPTGQELLPEDLSKQFLEGYIVLQQLAELSRQVILRNILSSVIPVSPLEIIHSPHNFVKDDMMRSNTVFSSRVTRLIVLGNQIEGNVIGEGTDSRRIIASLTSSSGRLHSKASARTNFTEEEYEKAMRESGVWCPDPEIRNLHNSPMAFRSMYNLGHFLAQRVWHREIIRPIYSFRYPEILP